MSDKIVNLNGTNHDPEQEKLGDFLAMLADAKQANLNSLKDLLAVRRFEAAVNACMGEFQSGLDDLVRALELGERTLIEDCQAHLLSLLGYIEEAVSSKKLLPKEQKAND